jgi:hypothetical protein
VLVGWPREEAFAYLLRRSPIRTTERAYF